MRKAYMANDEPQKFEKVLTLRTDKETAEKLHGFAQRSAISTSTVTRAALHYALSRLISGEMAIINGELAPHSRP